MKITVNGNALDISPQALITALQAEENQADLQTIAGSGVIKPTLSATDVDGFLATEDGTKYLQPKLDAFFTKGLKTWQDNNVDKIKEDAVAGMKEEMQTLTTESEAKLNTVTIQRQMDAKLLSSNLKPEKLGMASKLIDYSKLSIDGTNLLGANDVITQLQADAGEWFNTKTPSAPNPANPNPGTPPAGKDEQVNSLDNAFASLGITLE